MRSIISAGTQLVSPRVLRSPLRPMRTASRAPMRLPSTRIRVFSGPMPRRSIWRLLPYWPEALLPVRLTPGMVRSSSAMSLAGGRLAMSSAVMVEVPNAWRAICEAVTCTVSISVASVSAWAVRALPASRAATASASGRGERTTAGDMIWTFWQGYGASGKGLEATTRGRRSVAAVACGPIRARILPPMRLILKCVRSLPQPWRCALRTVQPCTARKLAG